MEKQRPQAGAAFSFPILFFIQHSKSVENK